MAAWTGRSPAPAIGIASRSDISGEICMTPARRDCFADSTAIRCQRCSLPAPLGNTTLRRAAERDEARDA